MAAAEALTEKFNIACDGYSPVECVIAAGAVLAVAARMAGATPLSADDSDRRMGAIVAIIRHLLSVSEGDPAEAVVLLGIVVARLGVELCEMSPETE